MTAGCSLLQMLSRGLVTWSKRKVSDSSGCARTGDVDCSHLTLTEVIDRMDGIDKETGP